MDGVKYKFGLYRDKSGGHDPMPRSRGISIADDKKEDSGPPIFECAEFEPSDGQRSSEKALGDILLQRVSRGLVERHNLPHGSISIVRKNGPRVDGTDSIHLSLAHTNGFVCAVASLEPIGIDCERVRSFSPALRRKFLNQAEVESLGEMNDATLTKVWCSKEAVSKAVGLGLGVDLRKVIIESVASRWCAGVAEMDRRFALTFIFKKDIIIAIAEGSTASSKR